MRCHLNYEFKSRTVEHTCVTYSTHVCHVQYTRGKTRLEIYVMYLGHKEVSGTLNSCRAIPILFSIERR